MRISRLAICPYCGREMIRPIDAADPESMVFHIVRICQHMIECRVDAPAPASDPETP